MGQLKRKAPVKSSQSEGGVRANGHAANGGTPNELVFSTGERVIVRQVSLFTIGDMEQVWREKYPPPPPPTQVVEGLAGPEEVENRDHPDYHKALRAYNEQREEIRMKFMVLAGVEAEIDQEKLDRKLNLMRRFGKEFTEEDDPLVLWVQHVCVGSPADWAELVVRMTAGPSEEAVARVQDTFRREIQRAVAE